MSLLTLPFTMGAADLSFDIPNKVKKEINPGENFNLIAKVSNQSTENQEIEIKIKEVASPFKFILDYSKLRILKNTSSNKIIGIQVPTTCKAGEYNLVLEAFNKNNNELIGNAIIPIMVKYRYELSILKLNAPVYLLSGDTFQIKSIIQNLSNADVKVVSKTVQGSKTKEEILQIPKDSSIQISYRSSIEKDINAYSKHFIFTTAAILGETTTEKQVSYSFDVFPNKNIKFDRFNRFPIKIGTMVIGTNRWGKISTSNMFDISANGTFGKNNDQNLMINLRGPDKKGDPLLGLDDTYSLRYSSKYFDLAFGDENFNLSSLTESSRSGKGVRAQLKYKKYYWGGYYAMPKYFPLLKSVYATFGGIDFNAYNQLKLGMLLKTDTLNSSTGLYTISSINMPFKWLKTDIELALSNYKQSLAKSYNTSITFNLKGINSYFNYAYADPKYLGYISNSARMATGINFNFKRFSFSSGYNLNKTNMAIDTIYANMPYTENTSVMLGYRLTNTQSISIGGFMTKATDRSPTPVFDYQKTNARVALQSNGKAFNVGIQGDYGKMEDNLKDSSMRNSLTYSGALNIAYKMGTIVSTNAYISYQGGEQGITGYDQFYYGMGILSKMGEKTSLSLQYNSNFEWQYYNSDRSLLNLSLNSQISSNDDLSLSANYNLKKNSLDRKELNVQLKYIHTFNIPTSIRKDVGTLNGKINNDGVDKVSEIRLKIGNNIVLTDKEGHFRFPAIPVGTHMLEIDASSLGLNIVTKEPGPFMIDIEPGIVQNFIFSLTKASKITGKLSVEEDNRVNEKGYIPVKEDIERLIVEASHEKELFRVYTDRNGGFSFNDLRPGDWQIKIYTNSLPKGYKIETTQYNIALTPGETKHIDVPVKKVARQIQFQTTIKK